MISTFVYIMPHHTTTPNYRTTPPRTYHATPAHHTPRHTATPQHGGGCRQRTLGCAHPDRAAAITTPYHYAMPPRHTTTLERHTTTPPRHTTRHPIRTVPLWYAFKDVYRTLPRPLAARPAPCVQSDRMDRRNPQARLQRHGVYEVAKRCTP